MLVTDRMPPLTRAGPASCTRSACPTTGAQRGIATGDARQRPVRAGARPERPHPGGEGGHLRHRAGPPAARRRCELVPDRTGWRATEVSGVGDDAAARRLLHRHVGVHRLQGVRGRVQGVERRPGRAWASPASPTTTRGALGANSWRHVAFIEQRMPLEPDGADRSCRRRRGRARRRTGCATGRRRPALADELGRLQALHARRAASTCARPARCSAPSSARSWCRRTSATAAATAWSPARSACSTSREGDGRVWKCTLCYDRLKDDLEPACAQACPTESIQFGELDELRERAHERAARRCTRAARRRRAALRRRSRRRRRRLRRLLPAARRARGVRAAARPGGDDARPRRDLARRAGCGRRRSRAAVAARRVRRPPVSSGERPRWSRAPSRAPTTGGRSIKPPVWTPEVPWYFFVGGLAGASATLGVGGRRERQPRARAARRPGSRSAAGIAQARRC